MKSLSPEEAIAILSDMKIDIPVPKAAVTQIKRNVALDMAISALSCSEIPNSSDTISRQAAISHVDDVPYIKEHPNVGLLWKAWIEQLPSAQPERKRGRWIYGEDNLGTGRDGWFCSECGHFEMWDYSADMKSAELNLPNYCPNCGADMREVDE